MTDGGRAGRFPPVAPMPPPSMPPKSVPAPPVPPGWGPRGPVRPRRAWQRPGHRRRMHRWWVFWQSPMDQPRWARPLLLVVAALAGLSYAWGLDHAALEPFYGAAARSMSASWHNFFFGAFDPDGTISVDKLPGALWVQALSVRAFGVNTWAIVMPQVAEGILTVLVLYRGVRRLAGPLAGIVAAVVLAASPVTVLLNRGNVSDSLLILLLVLAADATSRALTTGRLRSLLLAGTWVGLAFQAKMTQAWLILPALWLTYLIAAPARAGRRWGHVLLATAVTAVVSLSWMLVVTAVPGHDRPYVDGSRHDSVFEQVFDYNGVARFESPHAAARSVGTPAAFLRVGQEARLLLNGSTAIITRSWHRLLSGPLGRDTGWLLPAALVAAVAVVLARGRRPRLDPLRACCLLWGTWLLVHLVVFSDGTYLNSYYAAALSPAIAALSGVGLSVAWRALRAESPRDETEMATPEQLRRLRRVALIGRLVVGAVITGTAAYALFLLPTATGVRPWLVPATIAVAVLADLLLVVSFRRRPVTTGLGSLALVVAAAAAFLVPSVASATVVTDGLGPFDTPFEPATVTQVTQTDVRRAQDRAAVTIRDFAAQAAASKTPILLMIDTSALAAPYILASGREVLPIGGFIGAAPAPTLAQIRFLVAFHRVRLAFVPVEPAGNDPRIVWIRTHCRQLELSPPATIRFGLYDCSAAKT